MDNITVGDIIILLGFIYMICVGLVLHTDRGITYKKSRRIPPYKR